MDNFSEEDFNNSINENDDFHYDISRDGSWLTSPVSKKLLRSFGDSIPIMVWVADKKGRPEYFNSSWFDYTGYTLSESIENDLITKLVHPDDIEDVTKHWKASLSSGVNMEIEYRLKHKSGDYKWFLRRVNPIKDPNGNVIKWIAACTDIDKQKKLEEALIESREKLEINVQERTKELQRSNEDLEKFAFVASHDLKEPLRMIASYSDLILNKNTGKDSELHEFLGYVSGGVKQMTSLITNLLDFSRVGRHDVAFVNTDLNDLVQNVLESISNSIQESGVQIHVGKLPELFVSPIQVKQLFQNLIENAIKFREPGNKPIIDISAKKQGKQWLFKVKDNGIGIDPQFSEQIFAVFQRLHTKEHYEGSGIGLSICKRVVEFHHGTIWVESKPGEGTTFYFALPEKTDGANVPKN